MALRAPFLTTYLQEGENGAYRTLVSGETLYVNASGKLLVWAYTPPVDVWVEATVGVGLINKLDAAYHYIQLQLRCQPAPAVGFSDVCVGTNVLHNGVNYYGSFVGTKLYGLSAGVAYTIDPRFVVNGGSWNYYQGTGQLWMQGKAWAR